MLFDFLKHKPSDFQDDIDMEIERLRASLNKKRDEAITRMGSKWVLHPDHYIQKQDVAANSLGFK